MGLLRSRSKLTPAATLSVEVGMVLEGVGYRAAIDIGKPSFRTGYYIAVQRTWVEVYYHDRSQNAAEQASNQALFADRIEPLLKRRFGAHRVKSKIISGGRQGFEVTLR